MQTLLSIALSLLLAWACAHCARGRGRNPTTWFIAGALFGIFALIALFIFPARAKPTPVSVQPAAPLPPVLSVSSPLYADKLWYYLDEKRQQCGPMSFDALSRAWNAGTVREQTFVWNEAMENWQHLKEVVQFQQA